MPVVNIERVEREFLMSLIYCLYRYMQLIEARRRCLCAATSLHTDGKCAIEQPQRHQQCYPFQVGRERAGRNCRGAEGEGGGGGGGEGGRGGDVNAITTVTTIVGLTNITTVLSISVIDIRFLHFWK